jgi:hypothetical protein
MCLHENKICGRCQGPFECKVGNVSQCHCSEVRLSDVERAYIASKYRDCLCGPCLQAVRKEALFGPDIERANLINFTQQHR